MKDTRLRDLFDKHFKHVKFNQHLASQIYRFQVGFIHKNKDHMDFFGGNLLGCHTVRFMTAEINAFWDIFNVDPYEVNKDLGDLLISDQKGDKFPITNYKIAGDSFNQLCMYAMYRFLNTKELSKDRIERAVLDIGLIFNYRTIAVLITSWFTYAVDENLAKAVHSNLSARYLIKRLNSWQAVMEYRAEESNGVKGLYREYLKHLDDIDETIKMINDDYNRIKDIVLNIYSVIADTNSKQEAIHTTSMMITDVEGEVVLKDQINHLDVYLTYMKRIVPERNSFIKNELVSVISKVMFTMQINGFMKTLEWISNNYNNKEKSTAESIIRLSLLESFKFLSELGSVSSNIKNLSKMLMTLKGCYSSSRSTDPELIELRNLTSDIINEATGKTNEQTVAAIRTGVFLYICLRAYTKDHYSN